MWKIGDIEIEGQVVLGPMSGYTSASYRAFMKPFGVAVSVTEMTSDTGVINGIGRTTDYVMFSDNHPTGLQLFGNDCEKLSKAAVNALKLNNQIEFIDINMGCPANKVIRNGSGSALMRNPVKCGDIIKSVKQAVDIPVTAKIRLGWDKESINYMRVIEELESAEVDAIAVHARTQDEHYAGTPHYDLIENLREQMSVPLIVSGNIYTEEDAINALNITGAEAVMVARGAVGNPFLITQIDTRLKTGKSLECPTISQQVDWCIQLADMLIEEKGTDLAIRKLRSIAPKFIAGCHRCRDYRRRLAVETVDKESLVNLLREIKILLGDERIRSDGKSVCFEE